MKSWIHQVFRVFEITATNIPLTDYDTCLYVSSFTRIALLSYQYL